MTTVGAADKSIVIVQLSGGNDALNTMPDRETTEVKPQKNTLLLHGSSALTAEGEAYELR